MMTAIAIAGPGGPEVLTPVQLPVPEPRGEEVLIEIEAAGINRADVMQRKGAYPPPPGAPETPGLEAAGTVVACGPEAHRFGPGDKVMALLTGGGYAGFCVAPEPTVMPIPHAISMVEAGAIPETFATVWTNVFDRGRLKPGESLLVHGGSSGIGTTAIMLAKALGSKVLTTAGSDEKCRACLSLGADHAINYRTEDFVARVLEITDKAGVDVVLDIVGGEYLPRDMACAAREGRIVCIATPQGSRAEIDIVTMMVKRLTLSGSTLRPRSVAEKGAICRALEEKVWPLLSAGRVRPPIYRTFRIEDAGKAHALMETSEHIGKIVLETRSE